MFASTCKQVATGCCCCCCCSVSKNERGSSIAAAATTTPPPNTFLTRSLRSPVLTPNIYANYKKSKSLWVCCRALQTHRYVNLWVYSALQQVLLFLLSMPALQDDTMRAAARPPCRKGSGPDGTRRTATSHLVISPRESTCAPILAPL